jgi:osmoprotectant transport system ATP-binding protein
MVATPAIEYRNTRYAIGERDILAGLSLAVERGETVALLGRSGSGKTTALRLINRLLRPSAGEILVEGKPLDQWPVITLRRRMGYVIQEGGLFPHYTVARNVALVPSLEGWEESKTRARVEELLRLVGLEPGEFAGRYPHELSGGQRQRVGVARALAADPPLMLMDEPFGALDPITRAELQQQFMQLQDRLGKTVLLVTHDLREALLLAGRIALLEGGRLAGVYSTAEFTKSKDETVQRYLAPFRNGKGELVM